jgi:hypothetical protein
MNCKTDNHSDHVQRYALKHLTGILHRQNSGDNERKNTERRDSLSWKVFLID